VAGPGPPGPELAGAARVHTGARGCQERTRAAIAAALRELNTPGATKAYRGYVDREIPRLLERLAAGGKGQRGEAARTLILFPELIASTREGLERALSDADWLARSKAAEALGKARSRKSLTKLRDHLCDPNEYAWRAAYGAIAALGDREAERVLREFESGKCW